MLAIFWGLLISAFLLSSGCSQTDSARHRVPDAAQAGTDAVPVPPEADGPVAADPERPGDAEGQAVKPEVTEGLETVDFSVPEIKAPEGNEIKLDQTLLALVRAQDEGGPGAVKALVAKSEVQLDANGRVRVEIVASAETAVAALKKRVTALDGEVTADFQNHVYALVPTASLGTLAAEEAVWSMAVSRPTVAPLGAPR